VDAGQMGPVSRTAGLMDWLENENMQHEQTTRYNTPLLGQLTRFSGETRVD